MIKWQQPLSAGVQPDWPLTCLWLALLSIGLVMVASASVAFAGANYGDSWYFAKRHLVFLLMSFAVASVVLTLPTDVWRRLSVPLLLTAVALLVVVLIPGLGKKVNGAQRWINLGFFTLQVSEVAKFAVIVFFAQYFSLRPSVAVSSWREFGKLLAILSLVLALLVLEPDFGGTVVIGATVIAIMFIAGLKLRYFVPLAVGGVGLLAALAVASPYRLKRLVTFMDPWADQFNAGYQLTQSLIAFGRGEWLGMGLGNSVQKLFYLPEAHTDFIFAIFAEELGLLGGLVLLGLFAALIHRILAVYRTCRARGNAFLTYAVFAIAVLFSLQVFINVGVASGLLPTKGLTLPFISYGGNSLLVSCALVAFVLRADMEMRTAPERHTPVTNPSRVHREGSLAGGAA
ncbi:putative lipid II flippase FtsW [Gilvimarinus algae]|uniref:Probable peptidoglycan glycosyltransferase FtsW n=1 Tax=Gilvimarinus algae TaxID=3058037 RepID=A0ABT8TFD3_9GAMM|nr:putative lipid II flippase FtsW [Gilvimarinus sp. SDUM040014]MDO3382804.1 putative lipid II flippase FtsW [Gilvimarinus sp. SDUM040014]